jgi:hypothetical protein
MHAEHHDDPFRTEKSAQTLAFIAVQAYARCMWLAGPDGERLAKADQQGGTLG